MKKVNKVLIALDYNPTAQKVAEAGYAFAKAMDAQVYLLHVITNPSYYASTIYEPIMGFGGFVNHNFIEDDMYGELIKTAQEFLDKTVIHLKDDSIETIIIEGEIATSILETAKHKTIDIIVLGSHSMQWLEKILVGSNTEEVLHQSTIPLFIIPTKKHL